MSEAKTKELQDSGLIEWSVFSELVAMDEDEEGFSKSLFQTFVDQVLETFKEIDENLKTKNFDKISGLGHYLKGSAAALGLEKISSQCERIQNYGHKVNFDNFKLKDNDDQKDDEFWIKLIEDALNKARDGFAKSRKVLNNYFDDEF
ncbi:DEHA2C10890p [Debaryomyces hansenii CBS767]|uniref:DEHA2C10890p n=1 Tax=Debaryomyces hansenii (strain ATCC 36239 / CBS 767 / BCRC 21394 / JCM 1990 / NBRC 0083 / IGC 2968) TaxID=284592 RepID=Q6BUG3_DEBHA|nr:DEHA2C10890p [Debaryomyces hansenii CBS767]CAG86227.1 DEHA2C10890p [Debaryomyces hansenii CBS767]|eukprot:XP_458156.1 DEHA2C10890p [Debaryomyces hansenii CBS767]